MEVSRRPATGKLLELTPLWESVLRYNRLPDHVDRDTLFSQLALRLSAPEWEVRQHALRVLADVIPVIESRELDVLMIPSVLTEIALNLGHSAPGVRKSALDVLLSYLQNTSDPEFVLRTVVTIGLDSPTANGTLASNVISTLPRLIDSALDKGANISHQSLVHLVTAISKKLAHMATQQEALDTLTKIRDHVGENRFDHFLESYYPEIKRDLEVLNKVYQVNVGDSGIDIKSLSTPPESDFSTKQDIEDGSEDGRKIILEEQISFGDDTVTMTVVEEDLVDDDKKSSRRVRFGGEVVKVRTPDSDVTIEIREVENQDKESKSDLNDEEEGNSIPEEEENRDDAFEVISDKSLTQKDIGRSHIPLPVRPALHMPHARRSRFRQEDIPTWDGGESLTSSSEGEQEMRRMEEAELANLHFLPPELFQLLHNKENWRALERGLETLPELRLSQKEWRAVVVYLSWRLGEPRLLATSLRTLGRIMPRLPPRALEPLLPWLVPAIARRLGSAPLAAKLEAALALHGLSRTVGPRPVVKVLTSDRCLQSRSSKLRENSLLGLLYSLMTYPSTEFDPGLLADKVMAMAPTEPKRRVRQAILEALAVLAQYIPRQRLILTPERLAAQGGADFSEALAARLSRRLLPVVSAQGLVLYALHIPPMTGRDVDWVLSGSGSLSSGSVRSRSQMELAQRDFYSVSSRDTFSSSGWSRDDMVAVGTSVPPQRSFIYSHNYGEDRYYDQVWAGEPRQTLPVSISQGSSRPLYLRYQNGQSDLQRGNVPENGFPQLSSSYNYGLGSGKKQSELSQTWSGSRWGESGHVSINQSLPPIANSQDWKPSLRWQSQPMQVTNVEQSNKNLVQDEQRRVGRWSRRQDVNNYYPRFMNHSSSPRLENGLVRNSVVSRSESSLISNNEASPQIEVEELARSTPSLAKKEDEENNQSLAEQACGNVSSPSSATSSLASIDSQPLIDKKETTEEFDNQVPVDDETDNIRDSKERLSSVTSPLPLQIDENENPVEIQYEDSKSLGTPNSEVGSICSKTTETSGNTIESILEEKPKRRIPRSIENCRNGSKTGGRPPLFPSSLPSFDNPKDGLLKTLLQMENPEWEVVMLGLQGLVRLIRHHSKLVTASSHSVIQSLVNNIRNLRSQVSRGSCQVAKELFDKVGRFLDAELEDLAGTLLSRTADTNKFLRGDALAALESMVDHTNPVRSVGVLINKGAKHQNALVRCSTARLLLRLAKKLGAERTLSLPRETKDMLVITTAKLLTEGSLDTRRFAKEIFQVLSDDPRLFPLISEVVPNNIQRNINKSLSKIAAKSK
ncbi:TOG array regulator of axonemal microtubules protein 1 isoform X2 [Halyomorpha halys]|uniref:TOG array regulator of axonemal microtubules protein 1 isoform X2 n=1 Tax=Halyomorpha halys TaxID=286706 RepID=UPI0006D51D7C|nr:uncharacterized protein LOC106677591 isoform X1 [Halyomorpha halys]